MPVCEICGNKDFTLIATKIREGEGRIMQCDNCELVIQDLDWDEKKLKEYYEIEYQKTNSLVTEQIQTPLEHFNDRLKTIRPIYEKIKPLLKPDSKVLDIGCGAGSLLSLIKPHVTKCVGVELNTTFVNFMKDHLKIEAYDKDINKINLNEKFDLIICISTLDHLPNPFETLNTMKKLLAQSGKIYLEVPNREEALNFFIPLPNREKFNEFFWHQAHLVYFTKNTIIKLFEKAGLKIKITCRHDYTLKNFLNWYFMGQPQKSFVIGTGDSKYFEGDSYFEVRMNKMFDKIEKEFKLIMAETYRGDSLCCIGWV
jgi:2-polyprenyl-3-methyl-5-hydroxy-6-metoxy-1,4-benzoquinol methylase